MRWTTFILIVAIYATLLIISLSELNPDWHAYRLLYESGGAWLNEQRRDPLFIAINSFSSLFFGPNGYNTYRVLIAVYFGAFITLAASGKLFNTRSDRWPSTAFLVALLYLGISRFTIQIREGLACSLIIIAMGLFSKPRDNPHTPISASLRFSTKRVAAWAALITATQIHISTLAIFILALVAWISPPKSAQDKILKYRIRATWIVGALIAITALIQLKLGGNLEVLASNTVGERLFEQRSVSIQQIILWAIYGLISIMLYREAEIARTNHLIDSSTSAFLKLLSGPAATISAASILVALILEISPLYVSNYARLLYLFLALALIGLSTTTKRPKRIIAASIFLIIDQARSVAESIYIYFGINIL